MRFAWIRTGDAGARRPGQIEETGKSGELDLEEAVLDRIDGILEERSNRIQAVP